MAEDQDKKDSGSAQTQASGSTSSPKAEVPLPPTFEIAVKSEKGHRIVIPETNVNNKSE